MGKSERRIVEDCIKSRQAFPAAILNGAELPDELRLFYAVFLDLTSCRTLGHAIGPIPWLAIHYYCEAHGIEGEQREEVFYHVAQLDTAYLDWSAKKPSAKPEPAPAPERPNGRRNQR